MITAGPYRAQPPICSIPQDKIPRGFPVRSRTLQRYVGSAKQNGMFGLPGLLGLLGAVSCSCSSAGLVVLLVHIAGAVTTDLKAQTAALQSLSSIHPHIRGQLCGGSAAASEANR
jgi:hypothetical protein